MADAMKKLVKLHVELSYEERILLSTAYKHHVCSKSTAGRIVNSIKQSEEKNGNELNAKRNEDYKQKIAVELSDIRHEVITMLDEQLIPWDTAREPLVFYYKMKGDYHRYVAEITTDGETQAAVNQALESYQMATTKAAVDLPPAHPTRLGLALNFAVFTYGMLHSSERGCDLAKQAFDEALADIETLDEHSIKDSTLIMQLLSDNLRMWTSNSHYQAEHKSNAHEIARPAEKTDVEIFYVVLGCLNSLFIFRFDEVKMQIEEKQSL